MEKNIIGISGRFDSLLLKSQQFSKENNYCRSLSGIYDSANNFEKFQSFDK